jgi:hypothetical protein
MHDQAPDAVVRRATNTISRRWSLMALSGAALGVGLARPIATEGKKKCKKKKCPDPTPPPTCPEPPQPPTCAEVCPTTCDPLNDPTPDPIFCFTREDGPLLCATGGDPDCSQTCTSDTDCVGTDRPYCVTGYQIMTTGQQSDVCGQAGAHCTRMTACPP